jgi:thioredoxin
MKKLISLLFAIFLLSCNAQTQKSAETIAATAFAEKIKATPGAQVLDVRTPEEFAGQHIENAQNVDWNAENFEANAARFDKSKPVFVYCLVGARSKKASDRLHEMGFSQVYDLQGGIMKWNAAGLAPKSDKIIGMCPQEYGEMLKSDKPVLVDFYAEWCAPCKKMAPYIKQMQEQLTNVKIVRLNADEHKTLISEMKIDELPALYLYKDGKIVWQHTGFIGEEELKKQL